MTDDYVKGLAKTFKGALEEAKEARFRHDAFTPHDFEILFMVESKNIVAFDNAREKFDPIARRVEGTPDAERATATKRLENREIIGNNSCAKSD